MRKKNQQSPRVDIEPNSLHNPDAAEMLAPSIKQTADAHRTLRELVRDSKLAAAATVGSIAVGTLMVSGALNTFDRQEQSLNFGEMEQVEASNDSSQGTVLEAPDGTRYQGVYLDGSTGTSFSELGLSRDAIQQVLEDNGLDAVPYEPTTVFVDMDLFDQNG